ncbi:MAG: hypothetical protein REH83_06050 [Rickettsiella sp.]|nr:hypothetical protein [Rickettsiella sp.]
MFFVKNNLEQDQFETQNNTIKKAFNKLGVQDSSIKITRIKESIFISLLIPKKDRFLRGKLTLFSEKIAELRQEFPLEKILLNSKVFNSFLVKNIVSQIIRLIIDHLSMLSTQQLLKVTN